MAQNWKTIQANYLAPLMAMGSFAEACPDVRKVKQLVSQLPLGHVIRVGVGYLAEMAGQDFSKGPRNLTYPRIRESLPPQSASQLGGAALGRYGAALLEALSQRLTTDFGRGFTATSLRHMHAFYVAFQIQHALRDESGCAHPGAVEQLRF